MERDEIERRANKAIKTLRTAKLNSNIPFMINTELLPQGHCYMEYPDGSIKVVTIDRAICDFKIVSELSKKQADSLRKKLKLD